MLLFGIIALCLATTITNYEYQSLRTQIALKATELHVSVPQIDGYLRKQWNFNSTKRLSRMKYLRIIHFLRTSDEQPDQLMLLYFRK